MKISTKSPLRKIPAHRRKRAYKLAVPRGGRRVLERNLKRQVMAEPEFRNASPSTVEKEVHKRLVEIVRYYDRNKFSKDS